jgi:chromosome segregation ATPase
MRALNSKLADLEMSLRSKELQIKNSITKLESKDKKIIHLQSEMEKLSGNIEIISENFAKQISYLNQKYKEKSAECENMIKIVNSGKRDICPTCNDSDIIEKINEKNKLINKLESRYQDLIMQTCFIKKTFFTHLLSTTESKNLEIMNMRQDYELKLMNIEDCLSAERSRNDNNISMSIELESKFKNVSEELTKKSALIVTYEAKIKELYLNINNLEIENKKIKSERDNLKKTIEDMKVKENTLTAELMLKESRYDNVVNELQIYKENLEKYKIEIEQLKEDNLQKLKENSDMIFSIEKKVMYIEQLEKKLDNIKVSHSETLEEVQKSNNENIEILNVKITDLSKELKDKIKAIEECKYNIQDLTELIEKRNEEIRILKENMNKSDSDSKWADTNNLLKVKIDNLNNQLGEKEKRINVNIFYLGPK